MIINVTGHRPNKLNNAYDVKHPVNIQIGKGMRKFILEMAGYHAESNTFDYEEKITLISGMALGVDTVWALVAIKLIQQFPGKFELECAIPCDNHGSNWIPESKKLYEEILQSATTVTYVSNETYKPYLMQKRNEYMVDKSDITFAVWDGTNGGTGNCVKYALKKKRTLYVMHPFDKDFKFELHVSA